MMAASWGTWEELLLGGAVLRHGTRDWNLVAAELRARAVSSLSFTPEVCKAKYKDLQKRFSGCEAWFEELRKQRMAELKRALELSQDSIGSLESKLKSLKAEKTDNRHVDYDSSQTEPKLLSEGIESSCKDTSKDGLSAGSFTQDAQTKWSPECQLPASVPIEEMDIKPEVSLFFEKEKVLGAEKLTVTVKKRRGKRKRKHCSWDVKEGSFGESELLSSMDVVSASRSKETSASNSAQIARTSDVDDKTKRPNKEIIDDLMRVFSSVTENECASVFSRPLDSQKRGRYKKMILRHMDFDTIRSRIASRSLVSVKELYRDMLLVANNALLFYSRSTREYKSAFLLRQLVTTMLQQHLKDTSSKPTTSIVTSGSPMQKPPLKAAKPRSVGAGSRGRLPGKVANATEEAPNVEFPSSVESLAVTKKVVSLSRPRKVGRGRGNLRSETLATRGRKRTRAR